MFFLFPVSLCHNNQVYDRVVPHEGSLYTKCIENEDNDGSDDEIVLDSVTCLSLIKISTIIHKLSVVIGRLPPPFSRRAAIQSQSIRHFRSPLTYLAACGHTYTHNQKLRYKQKETKPHINFQWIVSK